ncbi:unnamed protein product [Oikopleura dioica]|uniref:Uncharacterized protein n=1 Tax=Oikopleura dioica TaxID=34765 RepID=E4Y288_OIKDI|nr:unnamed protein product [Oikopleura dioica]
MLLTRRVLGKVGLANGPIVAPKNLGGDLTQQIARSVVIGMTFATPFYLWHFYTFRVVGGNALIDRITNLDQKAQWNRIRERGILHLGDEHKFHEPASWQVGYEKFAEQKAEEREIIENHISTYGIKLGPHGYETPFDLLTA